MSFSNEEPAVRASITEGDKLGVDATPTMFINGEGFLGVVPEEQLRAAIDRRPKIEDRSRTTGSTSAKK